MNAQQVDLLVGDWDDVYKKGQTTFWVLLALYEGKKYMPQIENFIRQATKDHFSVREQSLYRALRRFSDMQMIATENVPNPHGPDRKYYFLTPLGVQVLAQFTTLNIIPLYEADTSRLITKLLKENL